VVHEEHEVVRSLADYPAAVERYVVPGWFVEFHELRRAMADSRSESTPEPASARLGFTAARLPRAHQRAPLRLRRDTATAFFFSGAVRIQQAG
jgi:hypothetical protein